MMRAAIFGFGAVALSLHLFLHYYLEPQFKPYVSARFIERSDTIPGTTETISQGSLRDWINNHPNDAKNYLFPIIFSLDFLFMLTLAGFLALASLALAESLPFLRTVPFCVWIVAPGLYLVADLHSDDVGAFRIVSAG